MRRLLTISNRGSGDDNDNDDEYDDNDYDDEEYHDENLFSLVDENMTRKMTL